MKSLWQVLGEKVERAPGFHEKYWTPDKIETLKRARSSGMSNSQINQNHFPDLTPQQMKFAIGKHAQEKRKMIKATIPTGSFNDYWTPERKDKLKSVFSVDKTDKEIAKSHFPDLNHHHVMRAIMKFRGELDLPNRPKNNTIEARTTRKYWNDDKKYLLKRAWNSGKHTEDIHFDHFSDVTHDHLKGIISTHGKEWGLKSRKNKAFKDKANYHTPLDDEARKRIVADLKKTGATVQGVASTHYAKTRDVLALKRKHIGIDRERAFNIATVPDEHIQYAKELRSKKIERTWSGFNSGQTVKRQFNAGPRIIAQELNKKFPEANYRPRQVATMIYSRGFMGLDHEKGTYKPVSRGKMKDRLGQHKAIWQAHREGKSEDEIVAQNPHLHPSETKRILSSLKATSTVIKKPKVQEDVDMKQIFVEMNDNQHLTVSGWADKVSHHEHKASFHKRLYEKTPKGSEFKQIHLDQWNHHEDEAAKARFQHRKHEIISGGKK